MDELEPPLDESSFWRQVLEGTVDGCRCEELFKGQSPSRIFRVFLRYGRGGEGPGSVVCKESCAPWSATDPDGLHREWWVYQECLSRLPVVGPALLYSQKLSRCNRLVLADLEIDHFFWPADHVWSPAEMQRVLERLALLHLSAEPLQLGEERRLMPAPDRRWKAQVIQDAARRLADDERWGARSGELPQVVEFLIDRASEQKKIWEKQPRTLLHSDVSPANVAFERTGEGAARLIDWHIAASGMAAFEVASLFYQPYHNHRHLDRGQILNDYLEARQCLDGRFLAREEARGAFWYAMAFDGMSYLPPVARTLERTGDLRDWWGNLLGDIVDNLAWCREEVDR